MADDFIPGLEGVAVCETAIAEPDRDGGQQRHRGVDIEDLRERRLEQDTGRLVRPSARHVGPPPRTPQDVPGWDTIPTRQIGAPTPA